MRSLISKAAAVVAGALFLLAAIAPSASAQGTYPPVLGGNATGTGDAILAAIQANAAAAADARAAAAAAAQASVVAVPARNLAFTGSDVNLPLAAGALLVGSGGIVLLVARKRELDV